MLKTFVVAALLGLASNAFAQHHGKDVIYSAGTAHLKGYYVNAGASKKKQPGIVVLPAWWGPTNFTKKVADLLGQQGYQTLVADIYGDGLVVTDMKSAAEKSGYYKNNYQAFQERIKAAIDALIAQGADPDNIALVGYCFGGTGALEALRGHLPVKAIVSFHGVLTPDTTRPIASVQTKILILHGDADPTMSLADVENFRREMRNSKADWQMMIYADALHAFTEPGTPYYNDAAAHRSWVAMGSFLDEVFGKHRAFAWQYNLDTAKK